MSDVAWMHVVAGADEDGTLPALLLAIDKANAMADGMPWHLREPVRATWLMAAAAEHEDEAVRRTLTHAAATVAYGWHQRFRVERVARATPVPDDASGIDASGSTETD